MIVPTVGAMRRRGGATAGNGAQVAFFRTGRVGAAVFCLLVMQCTDGAYGLRICMQGRCGHTFESCGTG